MLSVSNEVDRADFELLYRAGHSVGCASGTPSGVAAEPSGAMAAVRQVAASDRTTAVGVAG